METFEHNIIIDPRGSLISFESCKNIPFQIKRVFCIFDVKNSSIRGNHAHHKIKQYLVAIRGHCRLVLDNGFEKESYLLDSASKGIIQDAMVWGTMDEFSSDCILMVFASDFYDKNDYIVDYNNFIDLVNGNKR